MEPCHSLKSFEVEFILIKRGARSVMHDGLKYTLNRRGREGQCYWRCADHMCPGWAITSENDELLSPKEHNHESNHASILLLLQPWLIAKCVVPISATTQQSCIDLHGQTCWSTPKIIASSGFEFHQKLICNNYSTFLLLVATVFFFFFFFFVLPRFCMHLLKFWGIPSRNIHWHHMMYKYKIQSFCFSWKHFFMRHSLTSHDTQ